MGRDQALAVATGQAVIPAPDQVAPPPAAPVDKLESTRFAHLAKKEAKIVADRELFSKDQEAFKREREELLKEREVVQSIKQKAEEFERLKATDVGAALKTLGFSETDIFNYIAAGELTTEQKAERAAKTTIEAWEKKQSEAMAAQQKAEAEAQEKKDAESVTAFKKIIADEISEQKETYQCINYYGPAAEEMIQLTFDEIASTEAKIPSLKEVMDLVEGYYENVYKEQAELPKFKPKTDSPAPAKKDEPLKPQVSPVPTKTASIPRTLTAKQGATVASTITKTLSRSEKRAELIEKLRGLGKK